MTLYINILLLKKVINKLKNLIKHLKISLFYLNKEYSSK